MPRYCFTLQVDPRHLDAYRRAHAAVWPEMLRALADAGWRDYSLHLRDDGLLIGIVETEDFQRALDAMDATAVNDRWQEAMAGYFVDLDGPDGPDGPDGQTTAPDRAMQLIPEIFHLETQLAAADAHPIPEENPR